MKTLYLDCFAGISGDMFLGALIDLGVSPEELSAQLAGLELTGYQLAAEKVVKNGISGVQFSVRLLQEDRKHRHLADIFNIINTSGLEERVKARSLQVFTNLAEAEGKIHSISPEKVHFHEVGAVDSIIDIVGAAVAMDIMGVEEIVCSPLPLGSGFVNCAHGLIPLPAPATLELLTGLPTKAIDLEGETVTPTGAALVKTLCSRFGPIPSMNILKTGYGAGQADRKIPNLLRVILGESNSSFDSNLSFGSDFCFQNDTVTSIEANIDDMNPEFYEHIIPLLFSAGAIDVSLTPVTMKKGRPGQLLTCLTPKDKTRAVIQAILSETTTLGVRAHECQRYKLARESVPVNTRFGTVNIKLGRHPGTGQILNAAPEWEDCKALAIRHNVSVKTVYDTAKAEFLSGRKS